jgi:hypothetical protein
MNLNNYIKSEKSEEISFDIFDEEITNSKQYHFPKGTSDIDFRKELNNQQFDVINEIKGPQLIIAGAGSGKTRTIVYCVAKLLSETVKPSEIMLVNHTYIYWIDFNFIIL